MTDTLGTTALRRSQEAPDAPYRLHHVRVSEVRELSPSFVRVTFVGPELDRVADLGGDQRFKLVLPAGEQGLDEVDLSDDWYERWRALPDDRRHPVRTYTVRAVRNALREVDVDLVRHGSSGPAGTWIEHVSVGDEVVINVPNRGFEGDPGGSDFDLPPGCTRVLLVGDETAAPAIAAILDGLPTAVAATVVVELPVAADVAVLPTRPHTDVRVVARNGGPRGAALVAAVHTAADGLLDPRLTTVGQVLEDVDVDTETLWEAPRATEHPAQGSTPLYAWLAGEAAVIKQLRRYLVTERGVDRRSVAFMGYWREGVVEDNR